MFKIQPDLLKRNDVRYGLSVVSVAAGYFLRQILTGCVGGELPTYITFYPAVMVAALAGGLIPGLLATVLTLAVVDYGIVSPREFFWHGSPAEICGMALFLSMGVFLSWLTDVYHRARNKAAAFEKELALLESQEELSRQREWLRVTLTSIGDAVLATDTAGRVTLLNPTAQKLTGWTEKEALGQPVPNVFCLVDDGTRASAKDPVAHVLRERRLLAPADHTILVARDGREIPIEHTAAPIMATPDSVSGVVVVFQDATEKRQVQRMVLEERNFMSSVLDTAGALVLVLDTDGHIRSFNRACELVSGYGFEEVKGKPFWDFLLPPEEVVSVKAVFAQLRRGQFPNRHENDWVTKDGVRRRITWSNTCILDGDGQVQFIIGTGIDVTERLQAEAAAREAAEQRRLALEAGQLGTWDYKFQAGEVVCDERCCNLMGVTRSDRVQYTTAIASIHEADRAAVERAVRAALAPDSTGVFEREFRVVWPDGSGHWIAAKGQAYFQGDGSQRRPVRFIGTAQDITERRWGEETLAFLAQSGAALGQDFFQALARFLAETLGAHFVCIDRLQAGTLTAQTVAVFSDGKFEDNVSYSLNDTPCGELVGQRVCCFPAGVRHRFPKDKVLQDLGAESYVGVTLRGHTGQPIGLIAVISRRPLTNPRLAESVLQLVTGRATGELERQLAEQVLRDNQDRLLLAQQAGHVGVFDVDFQANRSFWSEERKALFGLPATFEPTFQSWWSCVRTSDRAAAQQELERALSARRREVERTYRITWPDAQERWIQDRALVTYDAAGQPLRMVGISTDITEQVQAKERSLERLRQFRLTAVRTVTILAVSIFLAESANMLALAELPDIGPWWSGILDSAALMALISPVLYYFAFRPLAGMLRQREQDEEALRRANETLESRVKDRTANLELANQKLEAEMAERAKAEAEVRRAKDEWERTFDAVPDLIAILDERFRVVRANRAMAERLRLTPGECLGKYCYNIVHGMDCPPDICPNTRTLADGQEHSCDVHEPRLGGDFLITTTPLVDAAGRRIGSVHVARDITERKRAEAELRASYEELARFNRAMVGRELRMVELKQEVNQLRAQAGQPPRYAPDRLQSSSGAAESKAEG